MIRVYLILLAMVVWSTRGEHFEQRNLDYCAGYLGCHSCKKDSQWIFLNSACLDISSSTLNAYIFDYANESKYCNNGSSKSIDLRNATSNTLNLYQNSKFSITTHSTCFWNITAGSSDTISIQVNRSASNYEDINIDIYDSKSILTTYNSK